LSRIEIPLRLPRKGIVLFGRPALGERPVARFGGNERQFAFFAAGLQRE
jgi:hypothetical protein